METYRASQTLHNLDMLRNTGARTALLSAHPGLPPTAAHPISPLRAARSASESCLHNGGLRWYERLESRQPFDGLTSDVGDELEVLVDVQDDQPGLLGDGRDQEVGD